MLSHRDTVEKMLSFKGTNLGTRRHGYPTYTSIKTAVNIEADPIQVNQPREWNFGRLAPATTTRLVMNDHHTVQVA